MTFLTKIGLTRALRRAASPSEDGGGGLLWLFLLSLMLFILLLPFSSYVAAIPFIKSEWGLNNTEVGVIFSAYLAGFAASALFVVPLTDRIGSRQIIIGSTLISVISHMLFPAVANDMLSAIVLRAVAGIGLVGVYTPGMRIISERFSTVGRGMAIGTFVTFFYASNSVSLALTGVLMNSFEWREAYLIMSLAAVASVPLAYMLLRGQHDRPDHASSGTLDLRVLKNRAARYIILAYSLHAAELYVVRVWLPALLVTVLVARGMEGSRAAVTAATVGGIALAGGALGPVMGGILSDRFGRATSAAAIFAVSGAISWGIGWMTGFPWAVIIAVTVVYGWAIAADSAIYSTAITEVAEQGHLGSTLAVHAFLGFLGGVIGPIIVGAILDVAPESIGWGLGFSFVGVLAIIAILGLMRLGDPGRRST